MANTTPAKVSALMAIPDFDSNTQPTDTDVTNIIVMMDTITDKIVPALTATEKELLSTLLAASHISLAPGLFPDDTGKSREYMAQYRESLAEMQEQTATETRKIGG